MRWKLFIEFCLTLSLIYILAGDVLLPQPYRSGSQQLKVNLNHFFTELLAKKSMINPDVKVKSNS